MCVHTHVSKQVFSCVSLKKKRDAIEKLGDPIGFGKSYVLWGTFFLHALRDIALVTWYTKNLQYKQWKKMFSFPAFI